MPVANDDEFLAPCSPPNLLSTRPQNQNLPPLLKEIRLIPRQSPRLLLGICQENRVLPRRRHHCPQMSTLRPLRHSPQHPLPPFLHHSTNLNRHPLCQKCDLLRL